MIVGPKLIAVDDNPEHLDILATGFKKMGGVCLTLPFEEAAVRETPLLPGIRVVFMDIHLIPGGGIEDGARNYSPIRNVLEKLIVEENGPYALVTWTEHAETHDGLIQFLEENLDGPRIPCANFCLSKPDFLDNSDALVKRLGSLKDELPGLAMLFDWERKVSDAADRSVAEIIALSSATGVEAGRKLVSKVKQIGIASVGRTAGDMAPFRAFSSGMLPVLADRLEHLLSHEDIEKIWTKAMEGAEAGELELNEKAALNTFFHLGLLDPDGQYGPGTVFKIPDSVAKIFIPPKYTTIAEALRGDEFIPFKGDAKEDALVNAIDSMTLVFIQLGTACDFAQSKLRLRNGILAVQVPEEIARQVTHLASSKGTRFDENPHKCDWLFQTPPLLADNKVITLVANMRYQIALPMSLSKKVMPIFRLREQLADEIGIAASHFVTRIGLAEFRN